MNKEATLVIRKGSHIKHAAILGELQKRGTINVKKDFIKIPEDLQVGEPQYICAPAGSLILWDSRVQHCNLSTLQGRKQERLVVFVSFARRCDAKAKDLLKKRAAFQTRRGTSHWAANPKLVSLRPQFYGDADAQAAYEQFAKQQKQ